MSPVAIRRYAEVVYTLAHREFLGRYRGNWLGLVGAILVPLLFLAAYTTVFTTLMPIQIRPGADREDYAFFFFSGLIGWTLFADTIARAPRLFAGNAHFVRQASFPVSALPTASALVSFYNALIWLGVFVLVLWFREGSVPAAAVVAPLILLLLGLLTAGLALLLAVVGALARDLGDMIGPLLTVALFASPVIYSTERLAEISPWLVRLNPLAIPIDTLRGSLLDGRWPSSAELATIGAWAAAVSLLGVLANRQVSSVLGDLL